MNLAQVESSHLRKNFLDYYLPRACFEPMRWCGRKWQWLTDKSSTGREVALKALAAPFIASATLVSGAVSGIAAIILGGPLPKLTVKIPERTSFPPCDARETDEKIANFVHFYLKSLGCECNVQVKTVHTHNKEETGYKHTYKEYEFGGCRSREILLSSNAKCSWIEAVKFHFHNKDYAFPNDIGSVLSTIGPLKIFIPFHNSYVTVTCGRVS